MSDSAGVPWAGRRFEPNHSAHDNGAAPEQLIDAIRRFRAGELGEAEVIAVIAGSRLLVPLVAELGEEGTSPAGHRVDKSQELSIVSVRGPDGRTVLPAFTSVSAMSAWNPLARPVPVAATRVALAAVSEGTELVVLDPTSDSEFAMRRPALWSIAQSLPWTPCYLDPEVLEAFRAAAATEPAVLVVTLASGDPTARLVGPELLVRLALVEGLDRPALDALMARLATGWAASEIIADRVDSMRVQLLSTA